MITGLLLLLLAAGPRDMPPPCPTEDSVGCTWDAQTQGNGRGDSFIVLPDGTVVYDTHWA
jgi:hypothetical protein